MPWCVLFHFSLVLYLQGTQLQIYPYAKTVFSHRKLNLWENGRRAKYRTFLETNVSAIVHGNLDLKDLMIWNGMLN
jgi:hypothetical protein